MDASETPVATPQGSAALIVHNGRQIGTRRPLSLPVTVIGRAQGCDIRLNVEGIDDWHCVLAQGPAGLLLRHLSSQGETLVNGRHAANPVLHHGDVLSIGPFQFLVDLPESPAPASRGVIERDGVRVQAAAVAAQQVALEEEEIRLVQRRGALACQEEQLANHLEERRRQLLQLTERAQAERAELMRDRADYERQLQQFTGDLSQGQKELIENQQKLQQERQRLVDLHRRIRQRYHRFWLAERRASQRKEAILVAERDRLRGLAKALKDEEAALAQKRLQINTQAELDRRRLEEADEKLRRRQYRWRHRRGQERAALRVRTRDLEEAEAAFAREHRALLHAKNQWQAQKQVRQAEIDHLENRGRSRHEKLLAAQAELERLDKLIEARRQALAALPPVPGEEPAAALSALASEPGLGPIWILPSPPPALAAPPAPTALEPLPKSKRLAKLEEECQKRLVVLEAHAADLADQRLHLVELWQRLGMVHLHWDTDHEKAIGSLEDLAVRMHEQEQQLQERQRDQQEASDLLRERQENLQNLRHQLAAWRARLQVKEHTWDGERRQLLTELCQREQYLQTQLESLVELKRRWQKRWQQEMDQAYVDRQALEAVRKEHLQARLDLNQRVAALEHEKRLLADKAVALEQYRREYLARSFNPGAERRVERLRRRWLGQNAAAIRASAREREQVGKELKLLEQRSQELQDRADAMALAHAEFRELQADWEHRQALAQARRGDEEMALRRTESQRQLAEQQLALLREGIEHIARTMYDDEPLRLEQAA